MKRSLLVLVLILLAAPALAQTVVVNPTTIAFTASADHARPGLDGQPLVARYEARFFLEGASQPYQVKDLGKPTPDAQNTITVVDRSMFLMGAIYNVKCIAKVSAIGPSGEGVSDPSNPFGNAGPPGKVGPPVIR